MRTALALGLPLAATLERVQARAMSEAIGEFDWPEERTGLERETEKWWVFLALGAVSAVLGVILMFDLVAAVSTLALLVALGLVVTGVGALITAGRYRNTLRLVAELARQRNDTIAVASGISEDEVISRFASEPRREEPLDKGSIGREATPNRKRHG